MVTPSMPSVSNITPFGVSRTIGNQLLPSPKPAHEGLRLNWAQWARHRPRGNESINTWNRVDNPGDSDSVATSPPLTVLFLLFRYPCCHKCRLLVDKDARPSRRW